MYYLSCKCQVSVKKGLDCSNVLPVIIEQISLPKDNTDNEDHNFKCWSRGSTTVPLFITHPVCKISFKIICINISRREKLQSVSWAQTWTLYSFAALGMISEPKSLHVGYRHLIHPNILVFFPRFHLHRPLQTRELKKKLMTTSTHLRSFRRMSFLKTYIPMDAM